MEASKTILVVGGSSGIGAEVVRRLVEARQEVLVVSRQSSEMLADLGCRHLSLDVTGDDLTELKAFIPNELHGVVYCPGSITLKPFQSLKVEDFMRDYQVNLLGAVKVLQAALPALRRSSRASVVLFSTVATGAGMSYHAAIVSAKAAVEGLSLSLAAEYARTGIRFNVVAPSLTDTRLAASLLSTEEKRQASADRHPLKRIGQPVDIAAAVTYLLSDEAGWITGQVFRVDGGLSTLKPL